MPQNYCKLIIVKFLIKTRGGKYHRLFATQNPNTGFFKGMRESMSQSFLSRFVPLLFKSLPKEELCSVVNDKLSTGFSEKYSAEILRNQSRDLVHFHFEFENSIWENYKCEIHTFDPR